MSSFEQTPEDRVPGPDHSAAGTTAVQTNDPAKVSPKVLWPLIIGVVLTGIATFLSALTPEMLAFAGQYAVPLVLALGVIAQAITGYLKGDPARTGYEPTQPVDYLR